jgi:hypothetical protein
MKTFKCSFGNGVAAILTVTDEFPTLGESHIQRVEWVGNPRKVHPDKYVAWINSVNSVLAAEWGKKITHVFTIGNDMKNAQVWIYEPGEPPKLIPTPDFNNMMKAKCVGVFRHEKKEVDIISDVK